MIDGSSIVVIRSCRKQSRIKWLKEFGGCSMKGKAENKDMHAPQGQRVAQCFAFFVLRWWCVIQINFYVKIHIKLIHNWKREREVRNECLSSAFRAAKHVWRRSWGGRALMSLQDKSCTFKRLVQVNYAVMSKWKETASP